MRFPTEFIERLRDQLPISVVIGKRIALRKHGREFQAVCPFHKEKSPSFTVNDDKNFYHCFGCGAHGDAIGFIRDYDGVTYPEAIERLAQEAGVPLPKLTREAEAQERRRHSLEEVMEEAARWFGTQLQQSAGNEARAYLVQRELGPDMVEAFRLGFAPNQRDGLKAHMLKQGISDTLLRDAGLIARTEEGTTYDRFRGRLIFPILNAQGKIIAFGGRILPSAQTPNAAKYLNSPETPLFKKGENLFAYDKARRAAHERGTLLVAEGYMDVIALHKAGFTHAVAPLGTAITEAQLRLLWRNAPEPILCLDGDAAGKRAMMRAAELALPQLKAGYSLRFAYLPAGEDPDSLLRQQGKAALEEVLAHPKRLSEALWEESLSRFGSATAEQRAALEQHLTQQTQKVADKLMAQHLLQYYKDQIYALSRQVKPAFKKGAVKVPSVVLRPLPDENAADIHIKPIENQIVTTLLLHPSLLDIPQVEEQFAHMDLSQTDLDNLRSIILEIQAGSPSSDSKTLCAAIAERGYGEKVNTLLHSEKAVWSPSFRNQVMTDGVIAAKTFEKAFFAYELAKADHDLHLASLAYQRDMTEENQTRLYELNKYKQSLESSRYRVTHDEQFS